MDETNSSTGSCSRNITTVTATIDFSSDIQITRKCIVSQASSMPRTNVKFSMSLPYNLEGFN